jgi:hypothetical protein
MVSTPSASTAPDVASSSIATDVDPPAAGEFVPEVASENHLMPILVITLVAILAFGVIGYFAYTLFK